MVYYNMTQYLSLLKDKRRTASYTILKELFFIVLTQQINHLSIIVSKRRLLSNPTSYNAYENIKKVATAYKLTFLLELLNSLVSRKVLSLQPIEQLATHRYFT